MNLSFIPAGWDISSSEGLTPCFVIIFMSNTWKDTGTQKVLADGV